MGCRRSSRLPCGTPAPTSCPATSRPRAVRCWTSTVRLDGAGQPAGHLFPARRGMAHRPEPPLPGQHPDMAGEPPALRRVPGRARRGRARPCGGHGAGTVPADRPRGAGAGRRPRRQRAVRAPSARPRRRRARRRGRGPRGDPLPPAQGSGSPGGVADGRHGAARGVRALAVPDGPPMRPAATDPPTAGAIVSVDQAERARIASIPATRRSSAKVKSRSRMASTATGADWCPRASSA
jgi:hypothetical protein